MIDVAVQDAAIAAVRAAAGVTSRVQAALVSSDTLEKRDKSPVTVADFASQAVVCSMLDARYPVVGEENADELRRSANTVLRETVVRHVAAVRGDVSEAAVLDCIDRGGFDPAAQRDVRRYWTLDPIDGTKGFLRGEQYAIALALIDQGQVVMGVLGCPNLPLESGSADGGSGLLMVAVRGGGCRMMSLKDDGAAATVVRVGEIADPASARFCESVESGHSDQSQSAAIARHLGITAEPVRMDSQVKYAVVARGEASIYLRLPTRADYHEKIWDHAAGMLVVQEAGGRVTDATGKPLDFSLGRALSANRGIIATNSAIHDAVVEAVQGTSGP